MKRNIERASWVFEFNKKTFFITTFLPCYPITSSRYTHGVEECFILFQPEVSFAIHDLPFDTPYTEWLKPVTVRDRIRIAFKQSNRGYHIRNTVKYPMAYDIIKPIDNNSENIVRWWDNLEKIK
jgi:hypothetical protein